MSHPTWVRGLKQTLKNLVNADVLSHPTWVRGLKQVLQSQSIYNFAGRTLRGCVD